jgi:hypothetical protein
MTQGGRSEHLLGLSRLHDGFQDLHCVGGAIRFAFLKILCGLPHGIRDMGKAENFLVSGLRERIERGGFHLNRQHSF